MRTCSSLLKRIVLRLIFIFISVFMIECEGINTFLSLTEKNYCPFIETLSFGSDIHIKCNNSYLIFNEINSDKLNWKFANQTSICIQNGTQQAYFNQCGVSRIDSNYLKVPVKSLKHNEKACVYCRINYKPIAPMITTSQSDDGQHILYTFNLTATGLAPNESFEILWAKRASQEIHYSVNYWFLQECVDSIVTVLEDTGHTIIFVVDDITIHRVEFIIRRCNGACRNYKICREKDFNKEVSLNYFHTPDSIEKISCDSDCLHGFITTPITHLPSPPSSTTTITTTTQLSSEKPSTIAHRLNFIILFSTIGLLLILGLIILIIYVHHKIKEKKHVYAKTSNVNPDEHK